MKSATKPTGKDVIDALKIDEKKINDLIEIIDLSNRASLTIKQIFKIRKCELGSHRDRIYHAHKCSNCQSFNDVICFTCRICKYSSCGAAQNASCVDCEEPIEELV